MASALVAALTAPLHELQARVGSGVFTGDDPARMLLDASQGSRRTWAASGAAATGQVGEMWSGLAADTAGDAHDLDGPQQRRRPRDARVGHGEPRGRRIGRGRAREGAAAADRRRLRGQAYRLERDLPASAGSLADATRRALTDAAAVVAELEAELDGHAAAVAESGAAVMPAAPVTSPAGLSPASGWYPQSSMSPAVAGVPSTLMGLTSGVLPGAGFAEAPMLDSDWPGSGVAVRLPDGSTVKAPNRVAADAVRHALTQLGVPYDWGGTTPGVGLDCSGLTQWAYDEAGLNLPRLAQEQDVGAAVSPNALLPGDLAVWDGHVAMVVGNGMMIEAGDPVQLSPIRTTNLNQGFQGFFRPTA